MATARPPVELTVDQKAIVAVRKAMAAESDGKALRRDLLRDIRAAVAPAVPVLQAAVRALPDLSPAESSPRLREAVAQQIKVGAALSGQNPGAKITVGTKRDPRGFRFAGRRLNSPKGWRHPVFDRTKRAGGIRGLLGQSEATWVVQYGNRGVRWFEPNSRARSDEYRVAVKSAVDAMAKRIASETTRRQQ